MIKNLLLDWSGVISDDFSIVYGNVIRVLREYGVEKITLEEFKQTFRFPTADYYKFVLPGIPFDEINAVYTRLIKETDTPVVYPGAVEAINSLHKSGIALAVFSTHHGERLLSEMDSYGIQRSTFTAIGTDIGNKVESINPFITSLGWDRLQTAYVGDTEHDIASAKAAGVVSIASTYGYRSREQIIAAQPHYLLNAISELPDLVRHIS